jgi:hypothetical protein
MSGQRRQSGICFGEQLNYWASTEIAFGQLYRDHHATVGLPPPSPRSAAGLLTNEGIFGASPSDPVLEVIEKLKRHFKAATDTLDVCGREHRMSRGSRLQRTNWLQATYASR